MRGRRKGRCAKTGVLIDHMTWRPTSEYCYFRDLLHLILDLVCLSVCFFGPCRAVGCRKMQCTNMWFMSSVVRACTSTVWPYEFIVLWHGLTNQPLRKVESAKQSLDDSKHFRAPPSTFMSFHVLKRSREIRRLSPERGPMHPKISDFRTRFFSPWFLKIKIKFVWNLFEIS